jgi:hypothetical protein
LCYCLAEAKAEKVDSELLVSGRVFKKTPSYNRSLHACIKNVREGTSTKTLNRDRRPHPIQLTDPIDTTPGPPVKAATMFHFKDSYMQFETDKWRKDQFSDGKEIENDDTGDNQQVSASSTRIQDAMLGTKTKACTSKAKGRALYKRLARSAKATAVGLSIKDSSKEVSSTGSTPFEELRRRHSSPPRRLSKMTRQELCYPWMPLSGSCHGSCH